jgi:hypothetical protein
MSDKCPQHATPPQFALNRKVESLAPLGKEHEAAQARSTGRNT